MCKKFIFVTKFSSIFLLHGKHSFGKVINKVWHQACDLVRSIQQTHIYILQQTYEYHLSQCYSFWWSPWLFYKLIVVRIYDGLLINLECRISWANCGAHAYHDMVDRNWLRWLFFPFSCEIWLWHYSDVIMGVMASQITSLMVVYSSFIQTHINENIKALRHWHLRGEFTGDRWIPRTNGQ